MQEKSDKLDISEFGKSGSDKKKKKRRNNENRTEENEIHRKSPKGNEGRDTNNACIENQLAINDIKNDLKNSRKKRERGEENEEQVEGTSETEGKKFKKKRKKERDLKTENMEQVANKTSRDGSVAEHDVNTFRKEIKSEKTTATVGQWGTAQFENAERQKKFLRLLGGIKSKSIGDGKLTADKKKNSLFGGLATLASGGGKSAMTSTEQATWRNNMQSQFDKALMYKGQKGGGLGFEKQQEEGKKFHINIHKSNSIKFDD